MANGTMTSTAQTRRPGRSVRSIHHAARVPMTAQRSVTTTVSRTVFQSRLAVSGLQMRWAMVLTPAPRASISKKTSGANSTRAITVLTANRTLGGRSRRAAAGRSTPSRLSVAGVAVTSRRRGTANARSRASQEPGLLQQGDRTGPVTQLGDGDRIRLESIEGGLGLGRGHPRGDGVLEADRTGDDLLALLAHDVGEESLRGGLVRARTQDRRPRHVQHVARVARSEVG